MFHRSGIFIISALSLVYSYLFTVYYNASYRNLYLNQSRLLIPDGIHLIFLKEVREERKARPIILCLVLSKEAYSTIFIMSGSMGWISNP